MRSSAHLHRSNRYEAGPPAHREATTVVAAAAINLSSKALKVEFKCVC